MAAKNDEAAEVTQTAADSPAGVDAGQVKPAADMSAKELKAQILHAPDKDLHPAGAPAHAADKSPYPGPTIPPAERPPWATTRYDVPIVQSAVTGAGAHMPPDPAVYDEMGRLRD